MIKFLKTLLKLSSLYYGHPQWFKDCFRSLNEASVSLSSYGNDKPYDEEYAQETINMLQELRSARSLTLSIGIVECLSAFPDLLSHHPSPFSNLVYLNIDSGMSSDAYKVKMSTEARNFLLENSPNATFIMQLPEPPPTKAMKVKEAREKKRAKLLADIESDMKELQALVEKENMLFIERKSKHYENHANQIKLMQFLMGLDDVYQPIRSNILMREPLPLMKTAFAIVSGEESHRNIICSKDQYDRIHQGRSRRSVPSLTHQRPQQNEDQYAYPETQYAVFKIWNQYNILEDIKRGPYSKKSLIRRIESRLRPYHFNYPERSLTMEEMLNKFIDEGKREHEEMRAFIYDFQTNNELLFKERNNSLIELRFGVQELLKVINNVPMIDCDVKGVTTRGGKTTTQDVHDNDTNVLPKEPVVVEPKKPIGSNKILTRDEPQMTSEPVVQPSKEQLHINLPFIEALAQMPKYAKFLKGLLTNKATLEEACKIIMNERCSAVLLNKLPSKEKDPGSFTIPCNIGQLHIDNALADLGASISLIPYSMYKKLGLGEPKATRMSLELADRSIQYPRGIIENVLIKVDKFVLPIDFVILDMPEDSRVPIILGRQFLATARAMIDVFNKKITLRVGDDEVLFDVDQSIKRPTTKDDECYGIDDLDDAINDEAQELMANEEPDSDKSFPIIVSSELSDKEKISLLQVLERRKGVIAWKISNIKGISPTYCAHKILMEDDYKPVIQPQRRLNLKVQDVVKNEIVKLLDSRLIYAISNSSWDSSKYQSLQRIKKRLPSPVLMGLSLTDECPNLDRMLARCEETDLVLNWEKCHFVVKKGIVLGHKISRSGIEVDRAKIDVIAKLPYSTNVKGVRSFLGHARFYQRFIKDFSTISKPMTQLLMKDAKFDFFDDCKKAFNILKEKLTTAPIIISLDWNAPFELMCDASDFTVEAVLGQRIDGKFKPIYYASKTLNNAQEHYTTTEKELLAVVFSFDKFCQYLILSKTLVYTNHSALKYLFIKEDAKPRLIRSFVKLENPDLGTFTEEEITDEFPDEYLMILKAELNNNEPWYADYVNYIVGKIVQLGDIIVRQLLEGKSTNLDSIGLASLKM
ncbi:reverse transcriptase domain-containing protein, partial [Tanacetum coccineum]